MEGNNCIIFCRCGAGIIPVEEQVKLAGAFKELGTDVFELHDLFGGLLKSIAFGAIISIIGCYNGFNTSGGAEGVGKSTTRAVVVSSILILLADYGIASLVFG